MSIQTNVEPDGYCAAQITEESLFTAMLFLVCESLHPGAAVPETDEALHAALDEAVTWLKQAGEGAQRAYAGKARVMLDGVIPRLHIVFDPVDNDMRKVVASMKAAEPQA